MADSIRKNSTLSVFERPVSINKIIDVLIFLYVTSIYVLSYSSVLNLFSKIIALVLMGILALYVISNNKIHTSKLFLYFGLFFVFCVVSCLWAIDISAALSKCFTLFQIFVLTFLLYAYLQKENKLDFFIKVLCWAGTIFATYTVLYFGISEYFNGLEEGTRMGTEITNVNAIGMTAASAAAMGFWFVFYRKKYWYLISVAICTVVTLGSGSRTALIGMVLQIVLLFVLKGNSKKKIISLFECVLILIALYYVLQLPIFETINQRMEWLINNFTGQGRVDHSASVRMSMIEAGLDKFTQTPFTGVGIGNSGYVVLEYQGRFTYLHNNYVELLASIGIIGTTIYYCMYFTPLVRLIKPVFKQHNIYAVLAMVLLFGSLILHYGTVQYYDKIEYIVLSLIFLIVEKERYVQKDDKKS